MEHKRIQSNNIQEVVLNKIIEMGGKILSDDEFWFPNKFEIYYYEDCVEANDWVAYPRDAKETDQFLLIITPDMCNNLDSTLKEYFENDTDI